MHAFLRLALVIGVPAAFAVAACGGAVVVDDDSSGSGGGAASASSNDSSTSTTTSPSVVSSSSGVPTSVVSASGGPTSSGTGPCESCGDALSVGQLPGANVCPGQSQKLYEAVVVCICAQVCAGACTDNVCVGNGIAETCLECIQSSCASEISACANDI